MVGEFRELEDDQESTAWTMKLSQRLAWADDELFANLVGLASILKSILLKPPLARKGVGPSASALLIVSVFFKRLTNDTDSIDSRWLAPLLTQTLPLACVFPIWDALFSRPDLTRDSNPKIEHLLNICTSMLLRARGPIFACVPVSNHVTTRVLT